MRVTISISVSMHLSISLMASSIADQSFALTYREAFAPICGGPHGNVPDADPQDR